jgi:hypothetical protein
MMRHFVGFGLVWIGVLFLSSLLLSMLRVATADECNPCTEQCAAGDPAFVQRDNRDLSALSAARDGHRARAALCRVHQGRLSAH